MNIKIPILLSIIFLIALSPVMAHPGRTASDGCHYCRTNCDEWGVAWNERHCHGGSESIPVQREVKKVIPLPTRRPTRIPTTRPRPTKKPSPTTIAPKRKPTTTARPAKKEILNEASTRVQYEGGFWERLLGLMRK